MADLLHNYFTVNVSDLALSLSSSLCSGALLRGCGSVFRRGFDSRRRADDSIIFVGNLPDYSHPVVIKAPSNHHASQRNTRPLERVDYENTEWRGWLVTTNEAGLFHYVENITTEIPGSDFEKIAKAESVRVELGPTKFKVSQKVLQIMSQMAGRIDLPADS